MAITSNQRAERREALIRAAMEVMAEQGASGSRLADIAARAGISPGHVLYYFESKADLFIQALRTVEDDMREDVLAATGSIASAAERLDYLLEVAAPTGPGDFRLLLWLDAWELAPRDPAIAGELQRLEDRWIELLSGILEHGQTTGEFHHDDLAGFALSFSALMDGLTIQVVVGSPHVDRRRMLAICRQVVRAQLRPAAAPG
jgi:AcrR family transcriptional regulator